MALNAAKYCCGETRLALRCTRGQAEAALYGRRGWPVRVDNGVPSLVTSLRTLSPGLPDFAQECILSSKVVGPKSGYCKISTPLAGYASQEDRGAASGDAAIRRPGPLCASLVVTTCAALGNIKPARVRRLSGFLHSRCLAPISSIFCEFELGDVEYSTVIDRHMRYVACTCAMHKLSLTHTDEPSRFLEFAL